MERKGKPTRFYASDSCAIRKEQGLPQSSLSQLRKGGDAMTNLGLPALKIYLFDSFRVEINGAEIPTARWNSKKAVTMLKYLAHKQGKKIPSEVLTEVLWPGEHNIDKSRCLHTTAWCLRKTLAPAIPGRESVVRSAAGRYWLGADDDLFVDVKAFEKHVSEAKRLEAADAQAALQHYRAALSLYTNDFLADDLYEEWTIPSREYYRELYFAAALRAAELLTNSSAYDEAVQICRTALRRDHTREEFYQVIIKALSGEHRYAEAVAYYRQCCQMLMREFQLEPNPYTQAIMSDVRKKMAASSQVIDLDFKDHEPTGAYAADQAVFRAILRLEERKLERGGAAFFLVVMSCDHTSNWALSQFQSAFRLIQRSLRKSDLVCQWSPNVILILLSGLDSAGLQVVLQKLKASVESKLDVAPHIHCEVLSSQDLDHMKRRLASFPA